MMSSSLNMLIRVERLKLSSDERIFNMESTLEKKLA